MKNLKSISLLLLGIAMLVPMIGVPAACVSVAVGAFAKNSFDNMNLAMLEITPSDLTWNGKEIMSINEAIFETVFSKPDIHAFHSITPGIVAKQQIAYLGLLGLVGASGAVCNPTPDTNNITMSQKFWDPKNITVRFEDCWKDLEQVFFVWSKKVGIKAKDLTNTDYLTFITDRLKDAIEEAKLRFVWFGDTAAAHYSDSPQGVIKNGILLKYWNAIDGLWKQIYAITAATATSNVAITLNAGASYTLQQFTTTDTTNRTAHGILQEMLDQADYRLKDAEDKFFLVTWSIYNQYKKELKSYSAVEASYELVQNGQKMLMFDGVQVIPFTFWDRMIKAYLDNGTKLYQPHRAVLSTKSNLQIGVESEDAFGSMNVFYADYQSLNVSEALWKMDAKVVEDYMLVSAY